jgi:tetratricopeptide (TPR) repeat protein
MSTRIVALATVLVALAACQDRPPEGLRQLGAALRADNAGESELAIALYGEAIESGDLKPETLAVAYTNRCAVRGETGDAAGALEDCNRSLDLVPGDPMALTNRGAAHEALGELDLAIRDQEDAIAIAPALAIAHNNLCEARLANGEPEAALASCDRALDISPHLPLGHFTRGEVLAALGRDHDARAEFRRAWQLAPDHPAIRAKAEALGLAQ